jgi:hypothetical protein
MSEYWFAYLTEMPEIVREVVREKYIAGVRTFTAEDPVLAQDGLLPPPTILMIDLECYEGQFHDLIMIHASSDFGIAQLRVTIQDEQGNVIESGLAAPFADAPDLWDYQTEVQVPSDSTVVVTVVAMDRLGAIARLGKRITLNQDIGDVLRGEYF